MGFGPLVNFWTFGFGLLWTEKMGLYTKEPNTLKNKHLSPIYINYEKPYLPLFSPTQRSNLQVP
jgi:hypothetical protein